MFDKSKINLNHIRASNSNFNKSRSFLKLISEDILERAEIKKGKKFFVLDLWSRTDELYTIIKRNHFIKYFQTLSDYDVKTKNRKVMVSDICPPVKKASFDYCFSIFSVGSAVDIVKTFKHIHELLKNDGKFICVLHGEDNLKEFKKYFLNFFSQCNKESFLPHIDMVSLAKIGQLAGFKNIVIDKNNFYLKVENVKDTWVFIRNIGEGNILSSRENVFIGKREYINFCKKLNKEILNDNFLPTLCFNFFSGIK